jgi:elongation factor P
MQRPEGCHGQAHKEKAMAKAAELKRGSIVAIGGAPHIVEELQVQTPSARGSASLYKVRFRNLATKQKVDRSLKGDDSFPNVDFERREIQFLYVQQDTYTFMDLEDFSQFDLLREDVESEIPYLTDGMEGIFSLKADGRIVGIDLPPTVELPIVECDPPLRGASVTSRTKPAKLSTGLVVQVPEYMEIGTVVRVDTRSGKFLSRA